MLSKDIEFGDSTTPVLFLTDKGIYLRKRIKDQAHVQSTSSIDEIRYEITHCDLVERHDGEKCCPHGVKVKPKVYDNRVNVIAEDVHAFGVSKDEREIKTQNDSDKKTFKNVRFSMLPMENFK